MDKNKEEKQKFLLKSRLLLHCNSLQGDIFQLCRPKQRDTNENVTPHDIVGERHSV